ncbi:MAG: RluA family pseudouridine synthase [Lachnospiraceae bacterium]|nr:RluA family pseudouridine synthase [Lachnospiraceae bacterium]
MSELLFVAEDADEGKRIDSFLAEVTEDDISRSRIRHLIDEKKVLIDDKECKASAKVTPGQRIVIEIPDTAPVEIVPENIPLDILYEDDDLLIVNKPKGMVVHPAPRHTTGTLVNAVMYHCKESLSGINGEQRPGIVHRIDKDTTGSLIICKNDFSHMAIAKQLADHSINRLYRGIVIGRVGNDEGVIDSPIARDKRDRKRMCTGSGGRRAVTHYRVLERFSEYSYLEFRLETGRTHQIRVHMAHIGHPILGDEVYGPKKCKYNLMGQTLHAMTIGFIHPRTGAYIEVSAPLPDYFERLITNLRG